VGSGCRRGRASWTTRLIALRWRGWQEPFLELLPRLLLRLLLLLL